MHDKLGYLQCRGGPGKSTHLMHFVVWRRSVLCQEETEDIEHFIMKCKKITEPRSQIKALQQPYGYRSEETLKEFLFNAEQGQVEMEMKKEWLYKLWSSRKRILNKQMDEHHWIPLILKIRS